MTNLEAVVEELKKQRSGRLSKVPLVLGVVATVFALTSTILSLKGQLFPAPRTAITDYGDLQMEYRPQSQGLTLTLAVTVSNDGNKDDVIHAVDAILETAKGKLPADSLSIADETEKTQKVPIIVRPGTLKMFLSTKFKYRPNDGDPNVPAQLQISFPGEKRKDVTTNVCFSLGSDDLTVASQSSRSEPYELSTSTCNKK